jgi:NAD(P)-dependent dehydrogenase (short-subunit alcohol dehydrogenase family)
MPIVLVTGASRGLGLEFARQYASDGWDVIACARTPEKASDLRKLADASNGRIVVHALDVTDFAAIDALGKQLSGRAIDVLINCAGAMGRSTPFGSSNYSEWEQIFRLNTLAPMKMAEAFVTHVARSEQKKIVSITTLMASIADNELGGFYAYRGSKAALNAIMVSMAIDLGRKHGIVAAPIHPGWVRTDMGGRSAPLEPADSIAGMRKVIAGLTQEKAGRFWAYDGSEAPW